MLATELVFGIITFTISLISIGALAGSRLLIFRRHMASFIHEITGGDRDSVRLFHDKVDEAEVTYNSLQWQ